MIKKIDLCWFILCCLIHCSFSENHCEFSHSLKRLFKASWPGHKELLVFQTCYFEQVLRPCRRNFVSIDHYNAQQRHRKLFSNAEQIDTGCHYGGSRDVCKAQLQLLRRCKKQIWTKNKFWNLIWNKSQPLLFWLLNSYNKMLMATSC